MIAAGGPDFSDWVGRRVLITGGLGFIGSTLAHALVGAGADVTLVDSMNPAYGGNLFNLAGLTERVRINYSDLRDRHSLPWLVRDQDVIFNLAGQTSHLDSMSDPFTDLDINAAAQLNLLEACRHHRPQARLVFASTRQIYGCPRYLPVDEAHPLDPVDVNGINKMAGENYHLLYAKVYGMWCVALRLTNTYGPRMRVKDARQTFLGIWLRRVIEGQPFEVWGGEQVRDYSYVDDTVAAMMAVAMTDAARGLALNVGGDAPYSLRDTAMLLAAECGGSFDVRTFPAERKRIDIGDYYADDRRLRRLTGWSPRVTLKDGLRRSVDYYRAHLTHYL
ncbi:MAG: GDP-mannose 4,6-dehydratase [Magnetospirillum gryphiswaldense]|nr:GDP-mannose 4,6-dehydratase [Magnetospirillum gryphiswaldense]